MDKPVADDAPAHAISSSVPASTRDLFATIVQRVRPAEAADLALACQSIALECARWRPSAIFYAERGAGPLATMVEQSAAAEGRRWPLVPLAIGTATDPMSGRLRGFTPTQKEEIIQGAVALWRASLPAHASVRTALLLDEVQGGGTISTAARLLVRQLHELDSFRRLVVVATVDTRARRPKKQPFHAMLDGQDPALLLQTIQAPLYTVDRVPFLNTLLLPYSDEAGNRRSQEHVMAMRVINEDAQTFFRVLALAARFPTALAAALTRVAGTGTQDSQSVVALPASLGQPEREIEHGLAVLLGDVTAENPARVTGIRDWFARFLAHLG